MSVASLAARLDALDGGEAFVTEGENFVTVSNVPTIDAGEIAQECRELGWTARVEDRHQNAWPSDNLDDDYAPFTVIIDKPAAPVGVLRLLTNIGLIEWLGRDDERRTWQLGRLGTGFRTYAVTFIPWDGIIPASSTDQAQRSARRLVREVVGVREVPSSMNRWLLADRGSFPGEDVTAQRWADIAARKLMFGLPNEVDGEQQLLRFKGPPRLDLRLPNPRTDVLPTLTHTGFLALQEATDWVFEVEREAEMRHNLLATEIARSGGSGDAAAPFLKDNIADALASAKMAYQVQLAGMSSDALKTLGELRKSVSDDIAKLADGTRQIITAVAGALAIGAGLIAARLSGSINPLMVKVVLVLAATYLAITIISGALFTLLQRKVRKAWQPRLYRFLTKTDYDTLVGVPAQTAERALWASAALGMLAIVLMAIAAVDISPATSGPASDVSQKNSTPAVESMFEKAAEAATNGVAEEAGGNKTDPEADRLSQATPGKRGATPPGVSMKDCHRFSRQ